MVGPADGSQPKQATQARCQRSSHQRSDRDTHMTSTAQRRKRKRSMRRNSAALHRTSAETAAYQRNSGIPAAIGISRKRNLTTHLTHNI